MWRPGTVIDKVAVILAANQRSVNGPRILPDFCGMAWPLFALVQ
jgi:hypothetical protein